MEMSFAKKWFKWSQLVLAMLLVQVIATGMQLLSRVILVNGTFIFSLMAYRHIVASIVVAPFAFYFEGKCDKKFGWTVWLWLFLNALTGITCAMGMYYYGLRDTSATYSTNFLNMIPIVTFALSIIMRMEKLRLGTRAGKIKTFGAMLCVGGALTTGLYRGKEFYLGHHIHHVTKKASHPHMLRGTLMLVGSCISYSTWFITQVKLLKVFPFKYWATMLTCIIASIQSVIIGVCLDRHEASWKLQSHLELITIVYSGALATAATFCLLSWGISKQGPTYPPMFNPLTLIFVAISEALVLGEAIRVGTLIGMVLIITGLYSFLWGKKKEKKSLAPPNGGGQEAGGSQLTAIVVPSPSTPHDEITGVEEALPKRRVMV
ncbi:hypothetical protein UlMin_024634 [Ulmus minor]